MKSRKRLFIPAAFLFAALFGALGLFPVAAAEGIENAAKTEKFVVEPPTLICLGFEWYLEGDDNRNAVVEVHYRRAGGEEAWKEALPLLRLQRERVTRGLRFQVPNMFAGSILDLEPDTEYECLLTMSDPDGVSGESEMRVTVRTRPVPKAFVGGQVLHAYPPGWQGPQIEPAFMYGLVHAYDQVQPGDTILLHAGLYQDDRYLYLGVNNLGLNFHGTYFLNKSGTPEKPIVIKAAGDGDVVFDGNGCYNLFNVMAASYNYFDGLTIRNTDIAFQGGGSVTSSVATGWS